MYDLALIEREGVYAVAARLRQRMDSYNRESTRTSKDECASGRLVTTVKMEMENSTNCLKVVAAVEEQYLSTDILQEGVMERPLLPPNLETLRLSHFRKVFML